MADITRKIICSGDGGLDTDNPLMDMYLIANARKRNPKVCLLPTASGDNKGIINLFERVYSRYPCKTTFLSLFDPHTKDIESFIIEADIIFVSGGQSKTMLGIWREWKVDQYLKQAYNKGTLLSGGSAGSVCWFDECITDSIPGKLTVMPCLGILPASNCPHFLSQERRASYAYYITNRQIKDGFATDDFAALHFENEELVSSVASAHFSKTYRVFFEADVCKRKTLPTKWLDHHQNELIWSKLN